MLTHALAFASLLLFASAAFHQVTDALEPPLRCDAAAAAAWNDQNDARPNDFTATAIGNLAAAKDALDGASIPFFLTEGTLLGWYRQCSPIPWDNDLDIGVMVEDHGEDGRIIEAMESSGFSFGRRVGTRDTGLTYIFRRNGVRTDIHFYYHDEASDQRFLTLWNGPASYRKTYDAFDVRSADAFGLSVHVPYPTDAFLRANYGDFTQKRSQKGAGPHQWDPLKSSLNVVATVDNVSTRRRLQSNCIDTNNGASAQGIDCAYISVHNEMAISLWECGDEFYVDDDFNAMDMCCACGGGESEPESEPEPACPDNHNAWVFHTWPSSETGLWSDAVVTVSTGDGTVLLDEIMIVAPVGEHVCLVQNPSVYYDCLDTMTYVQNPCQDIDVNVVDTQGNTCAWYSENSEQCGNYDDWVAVGNYGADEFIAYERCCACGGGSTCVMDSCSDMGYGFSDELQMCTSFGIQSEVECISEGSMWYELPVPAGIHDICLPASSCYHFNVSLPTPGTHMLPDGSGSICDWLSSWGDIGGYDCPVFNDDDFDAYVMCCACGGGVWDSSTWNCMDTDTIEPSPIQWAVYDGAGVPVVTGSGPYDGVTCHCGHIGSNGEPVECDPCNAVDAALLPLTSGLGACPSGELNHSSMCLAECAEGGDVVVACWNGTVSSVTGCLSGVCAPGAQAIDDVCEPCAPGLFDHDGIPATLCQLCPAGSVTNTLSEPGAAICTACDPGKFSAVSTTNCTLCPPGSMTSSLAAPTAISCTECPSGWFSSSSIEACVACPPGWITNTLELTSATSCTQCLPGQSSAASTLGCSQCAPGKYQNASGQPACDDCQPGYVTDTLVSPGSVTCTVCPQSTYDADVDSTTACAGCAVPSVVIDHLACEACIAGFEPNPNLTACDSCAGATFSPCGQQCVDCQFPSVVDGNHTSCQDLGESELDDPALVVLALEGSNVLPSTTLQIEADPAVLVEGSAAQEAMILSLRQEFADSLGVDISEIAISGLQAAGDGAAGRRRRSQAAEISFEVTIAPSEGSQTDPAAVLTDMIQQLGDSTSPLMSGAVAGHICTDVQPSFGFICPPGLYRSTGMPDCVGCGGNSIPDPLAAPPFSACKDCPVGKAPKFPTNDKCVCDVGFYDVSNGVIRCYDVGNAWLDLEPRFTPAEDDYGLSGTECQACDNMDCVQCLLDEAHIRPGFSVSQKALDQEVRFDDMVGHRAVFPCPINGTCHGNPLVGRGCTEGYAGPLCGQCAEGWSRPGFKGPCEICGSFQSPIWVMIGGFITIVLLTLLLYVGTSFEAGDGGLRIAVTYGKIIVGLIQIVTQLGFTLDVAWPAPFSYLVRLLRIFSMDWLSLMDIGCMAPYNYYTKFAFAVLILPTLLGSIACVWVIQKKRGVEEITDRCIKMALTIVFLLFPMVSQTIFQGFSCFALDEEEDWLYMDLQISCDTDAYLYFRGTVGALAIVVYPLGIPVATALLLWRNKAKIESDKKLAERYDFLIADYKPEYLFFDAVDMTRKVFMTGLLIFFNKGSLYQLVVASSFVAFYLAIMAWMLPYVSRVANLLKVGCELALLITLILTILLKIDLTTEDIGLDLVGFLLSLNTVVLPGAPLAYGILTIKTEIALIRGPGEKDEKGPDDEELFETDSGPEVDVTTDDIVMNNPIHEDK